MRSGSLRFAVGAITGFGMLLMAAGAAEAQSLNSVAFTSAPADTTAMARTEQALVKNYLRPAFSASFAPQQDASRENQGVGIGALIMMTRTSFNTDDLGENFDIDSKSGWGIGLWLGGNRNGRVGFTGEFIYLKRGDDDFKTTAFQIPAVFHINFGSRSRDSIGGYIVVGPSFTLNLKQESFGIDVSDNFNGADIGIIGGVGVEFFRIGIEGRGNWGLRSISSEGDVFDAKTFTFELLGKFAFN